MGDIPKKRRKQVGQEEMLKDIMHTEAREARQHYEEWKKQNDANPVTQRLNKVRLIMQIKAKKEKEILDINMRACKDMAIAIKRAILSDLNVDPDKKTYYYNLTMEEVKEVVNFYSPVLKNFEETANQIPVLKKLNYYEKMFIDLMDFSMYFAYFAPDRCFEYASLQFSRLSEEERMNKMKPFLEEKGILDDEAFVSRHGRFFGVGTTID